MQKFRLFFLAMLCATLGFSQIAGFSIESALNSPITFGEPEYGTDGVTEGTLYSNGPFYNVAGSPNVSMLQDATLGMATYGFGHALTTGFRIADDWVVTADVEVESFQFYSYQTGSGTTSTINHISLAIWDGDPSNPASTIVWGDQTTNVFTSSEWSGAYRQLESTPGATDRPIMITTVETPGLTLAPGTYWLDWNTGGTLGSGPWAPAITITGQTNTGNAKQYDPTLLTWSDALDVGIQGFPFEVNGEEAGGGGANCDLNGDTTTGEIWDRPFEDGSGMSGSGVDVRYIVYGPFTVDTAGAYTISSTQTGGWDGFLFVYQNNFDPTDPLTNYLAGDDDGPGGIGTSEVTPNLATGTDYFIITTGFDSSEFGPYTTTITGPGTYTCDGGGGTGVDCDITYEGSMEDGLGALNTFVLASDFNIGADESMSVERVTLNLLGNTTSVNVSFHEDNAGTPGAQIAAPVSIVPTSQTLVGTIGVFNVYETVLDLPAAQNFEGGATGANFWMAISTVIGSEGMNNYWEFAATVNNGTNFFYSADGGVTWSDAGPIGFIEDGAFTLEGTCGGEEPPGDNDDCDGAIAVSCDDNVTGTTADATDSGGNAAPDRFYSFTGDGTVQNVTVSLCGSSYDTYIRVFSDCTLTNEIAFNDDYCGLQSQVTFESDGTSTYIIMVEGFSSNSGDYTMAVTCALPPDTGEPDYPCFQGDGLFSNGFENGYNVTAGGTFRNADDFIVDDTFTIQYVRLNLFMLPGDTASSVTFNVRADEGGAPSESTIVDTFTAIPTSQGVLGSNFGYDISQVEFILDADRPELPAGTYWLQPEVTNGGGVAFWEVTSTGSLGSFVHTSEAGGPWNSDPDSMQAVFFVAGVCGDTPPPVDCDQDFTSVDVTNGVGFIRDGGGNHLIAANDFNVDAGSSFTVEKVTLDVVSLGMEPTFFDVAFYEDAGGVGAQIGTTQSDIIPTSITPNGTFGTTGFPVYTVEIDLPTQQVFTADATDMKYWVGLSGGPSVDAQFVYWVSFDYIDNPDSEPTWQSLDAGATWFEFVSGAGFPVESIMNISGTCETLGVGDLDSFDFAYYPNPVKDVLNITSNKPVVNVAVFNLAGQKVLASAQVSNGQINVSALPTGVYVFKATLQGGQVETFKIVKK